jgi:hypothetical protein
MIGIGRVITYCAAHRRFEWPRIKIHRLQQARPQQWTFQALTTFARAANLVG